ncbi:hypothetical protein V6N13_060069 [Hibiscus sabdariffa]|uniref:Ubiquitin-like protease family profile domain-containing protein n=1 Tax=Hibiscus sabdariffa TaxID=183260 RepID=A0ABR2GB21_9ROSI
MVSQKARAYNSLSLHVTAERIKKAKLVLSRLHNSLKDLFVTEAFGQPKVTLDQLEFVDENARPQHYGDDCGIYVIKMMELTASWPSEDVVVGGLHWMRILTDLVSHEKIREAPK